MSSQKKKKSGERTVLAFDFGSKSIGIAVGQEVTGNAQPLQAIKAKDGIPGWEQIDTIVEEWQPDIMVVGLPLNMDGTPQHVTFAAKKFGNRLSNRYRMQVVTHDERLSTVDAKARLFEKGGYKSLSKSNVDNMSACLILESWFEAQYNDDQSVDAQR